MVCLNSIQFLTSFPIYQAAVDSITRSLALEWGTDYDIRVNGIAPGPIEDTAGFSKLAPEEILGSAKEHVLADNKMGKKWDIAMAALYLASDAGLYSILNFTKLLVKILKQFLNFY